MTKRKFIIYSRKSKDAQDGHTQHTHLTNEWHITNYLKQLDSMGIEYEIVARHSEDISGGGYYTKRPIFKSIVEQCKADQGLTLLVAKADRMARNVRTGAELMETINFVLANAPDADDMQKHFEFIIAEREHKNISDRFKDTYKAKKARCLASGEELIWGGSSPKWKESFKSNHEKGLHKVSDRYAKERGVQAPLVQRLQQMMNDSGNSLTQAEMAVRLNNEGFLGSRGKPLSQNGVSHLIKKYQLKK